MASKRRVMAKGASKGNLDQGFKPNANVTESKLKDRSLNSGKKGRSSKKMSY